MAGEPAVVKVMNALVAALQTLRHINVFVDRSIDEPVMPDERPAMVARMVEGEANNVLGDGEEWHELAIDIDLYEESMSCDTITTRLAVMLSQVNGVLEADRTLGGLVADIRIMTYSANADSVPDLGCMNVGIFTRVVTPSGDYNTVMGTTGPIA